MISFVTACLCATRCDISDTWNTVIALHMTCAHTVPNPPPRHMRGSAVGFICCHCCYCCCCKRRSMLQPSAPATSPICTPCDGQPTPAAHRDSTERSELLLSANEAHLARSIVFITTCKNNMDRRVLSIKFQAKTSPLEGLFPHLHLPPSFPPLLLLLLVLILPCRLCCSSSCDGCWQV